MPLYEYQCTACDHTWEAEQKITEEPMKRCPLCGTEAAKRLISQTSFVLNGTAWEKKAGYALPFLLMFRFMMPGA